jgi:hypothetical protein
MATARCLHLCVPVSHLPEKDVASARRDADLEAAGGGGASAAHYYGGVRGFSEGGPALLVRTTLSPEMIPHALTALFMCSNNYLPCIP